LKSKGGKCSVIRSRAVEDPSKTKAVVSFEEAARRVPDLLREKSILDTSKFALTALRLLAKYRKLPRHVMYTAVGSGAKSTGPNSGDFAYTLQYAGFISMSKERFHGRMVVMVSITPKGLQVLKSRLKEAEGKAG